MTFILYFLYLYSSLPPFTAVFKSARSRVDCCTLEDGTNTLSHNNSNQLWGETSPLCSDCYSTSFLLYGNQLPTYAV